MSTREIGARDAPAVLYCHSPGSFSFEVDLVGAAAESMDARVVAIDRGSPQADDSVLDVGRSVLAAASGALDERFGVAAWSGGAPVALAVASLVPDRVRAVALACPLPRWLRGDGAMEPASERLRNIAGGVFPPSMALPTEMVAELDLVAKPWGFEPTAVGVPVTIIHGDADEVIPLELVTEPSTEAGQLHRHRCASERHIGGGRRPWRGRTTSSGARTSRVGLHAATRT